MLHLTIPKWVSQIRKKPLNLGAYTPADIIELKRKLSQFNSSDPLVSIVIPAWNEEKGILHTLISLANSTTTYATELIVVNNNSTDGTAALLQQLGIKTVFEPRQGIGFARTCGLHHAKGIYQLSCDCDTIYPAGWVNAMTKALINGHNQHVLCVHGHYSFLPGLVTPRWQYAIYEMASKFVIKKQAREKPYLNVLGFNCGIVRKKGIAVNGYDIPKQRIFSGTVGIIEDCAVEDGMMAMRLQESGGSIRFVNQPDTLVWTSDRRIEFDGGIKKAFVTRVKKHLFSSK